MMFISLGSMSKSMRERQRQFRRNKRLYGVDEGSRRRNSDNTPRERFIGWIACLQVLFLAWSFGSMHFWAQVVNMTLAVFAFFGLFLPGNIHCAGTVAHQVFTFCLGVECFGLDYSLLSTWGCRASIILGNTRRL